MSLLLATRVPIFSPGWCSSRGAAKTIKRNWKSIEKVSAGPTLAMKHFDGLYSKVYGRAWPSMRLGLLSPKKSCAIMNSFDDTQDMAAHIVDELGAMDMKRYYRRHLQHYTRLMLRQKIIENKKARKRELLAREQDVSVESIDPNDIQVSDVSDSELRGAQTSAGEEGFSSAEDLAAMFSDRRLDEDEKYFFNKASPTISLDDFVPATEFKYEEDLPSDIDYYSKYEDGAKLDIEIRDEPSLEFSDQLKIFCFPRNDWTRLPAPKMMPISRIQSHYLFDGGSLLPVLALDLQINDECADFCSAPGGKSLAMLMTFRPKLVVCNDVSTARLSRLGKVIQQYIPESNYLKSTLRLSRSDARNFQRPDSFDKILVDVPCSNDRHSSEALDNNIFKPGKASARIELPNTQCDILKAALRSVRQNGSVVYSTCTLSPIENDGVVQRALAQMQEEDPDAKFCIMSLKEAFRPLRGLYKFNTKFKYGQQVVPNICSNFGPMYISKIKRLV